MRLLLINSCIKPPVNVPIQRTKYRCGNKTQLVESVLAEADFLTLNAPAQKEYVIREKEFAQMKDSTTIINPAHGGAIDEVALLKAIKSGSFRWPRHF